MSSSNGTRIHRATCRCGRRWGNRRSGAAVVEFAILAPVLLVFVLGVIDIGQYVNVGHVLSGASRQGVRKATRVETQNTSEVVATVQAYWTAAFPALASNPSAITVTVADENGSSISGPGLGSMNSGDEVRVTVVLDYESVRWMSGTPLYTGQDLSSMTVMRRE